MNTEHFIEWGGGEIDFWWGGKSTGGGGGGGGGMSKFLAGGGGGLPHAPSKETSTLFTGPWWQIHLFKLIDSKLW